MIEIPVLISPFVLLAIILVFVGLVAFILTGEVGETLSCIMFFGFMGLVVIGFAFLVSMFVGFPIPQAQIFKMV